MPNIRHDVFPATVSLAPASHETPLNELTSAPATKNTRQLNTARVVVTGDRVKIAQDGPAGPVIVFDEEIDWSTHYKNPDKKLDSYVQTVSGTKIAYRKDSACGCGSRLRSWNPYKYVTSTADPTE